MTRFTPLFIFLGLALLLAFVLLSQTEKRDLPEDGTTNSTLPALALQAFDSKKPWDQQSLQGHITIINFFASWCTPCAAEMPELATLKKQFPDIQIIGVVWNDDPKTVHAFLKKHGNPFTALWLDPRGDATMALGIKGIPESFVIDAQGKIRYRLASPLTEDLRHGSFGQLLTQLQQEAHDAR
jgi:cytochrome c biogenesis protein CcmG/thiol:disulfide interchange protein DsbE